MKYVLVIAGLFVVLAAAIGVVCTVGVAWIGRGEQLQAEQQAADDVFAYRDDDYDVSGLIEED